MLRNTFTVDANIDDVGTEGYNRRRAQLVSDPFKTAGVNSFSNNLYFTDETVL